MCDILSRQLSDTSKRRVSISNIILSCREHNLTRDINSFERDVDPSQVESISCHYVSDFALLSTYIKMSVIILNRSLT